VSSPLVRYGRLLFGFCPSTRTFVPCFLRTSPRGDSPCITTRPSPPSGRPEDFHLPVTEHAQHTTKPLVRGTLRVLLDRSWSSNKSCRSSRSAVRLYLHGKRRLPGTETNLECLIVKENAIQIP